MRLISCCIMFLFCTAPGLRGQQLYRLPAKTLNGPDGMTIDSKGNIYIANWGKDGKGTTITRIDASGHESIYADGLSSPDGLTFDKHGNLFVSCFSSGEIFKLSPGKSRILFASGLDHPSDLKFDSENNLFVSCFGDLNGTKVLKIEPSGKQSIFADSLSVPLGLAFDSEQNLYVSCFGSGEIFKIDKAGNKKLYVQLPSKPEGYFQYLAFDREGNLYCPSYAHNCIYKIGPNSTVSRLILTGMDGQEIKLNGPNSIYIRNDKLYFTEIISATINYIQLPNSSSHSRKSVTTIKVDSLNGPNGIAVDKTGRLYIANEPGKTVIRVQENGSSEIILHSDSPNGLDFDNKGNLYISNFFSGIILKISGHTTDTFARGLNKPADIKFDKEGNLYVTEYEKGAIKKISPRGAITGFATGFKNPFGLSFDNSGNLYVANNNSGIINKVSPSGTISKFAQIPGAATYLAYSKKTGVLYAACYTCHAVYGLTNGKAVLISGNGKPGFKDGVLEEAQFDGPNSIAISENGDLYISEFSAGRIRKINHIE